MNDSQKGGARLMKSEHKRRELAPLLAIFGILVGLALASLLTPEREFSPNENRYLQLKPSLTWTTLMDGTFTQKAEDYVADQIALRDRWMEASSLVQRAALRLEINDTWLGRDGRYFAKVTPDTFDTAQYEKNLAQVKDFFDANPDKDCRMMMVPPPAYMLRDDLPANAPLFDAEGCFDTLLNTMGGDVEAGLAIAEMISGMSKPTVSVVLGGGHSIGVPLAVSAKYSFIVPSATMTIHPIRMNGMVIGVPQMFHYFHKIQERLTDFVVRNSKIERERFSALMMETKKIANDVGTILFGEEAVECGLIDQVGGIADAIAKLRDMISSKK